MERLAASKLGIPTFRRNGLLGHDGSQDPTVEQATKFELVMNLKAAKALGLTIAPSPLLSADRVIQRTPHD
jgi:ABC-type uncharacterized transport system substrate-binding protein